MEKSRRGVSFWTVGVLVIFVHIVLLLTGCASSKKERTDSEAGGSAYGRDHQARPADSGNDLPYPKFRIALQRFFVEEITVEAMYAHAQRDVPLLSREQAKAAMERWIDENRSRLREKPGQTARCKGGIKTDRVLICGARIGYVFIVDNLRMKTSPVFFIDAVSGDVLYIGTNSSLLTAEEWLADVAPFFYHYEDKRKEALAAQQHYIDGALVFSELPHVVQDGGLRYVAGTVRNTAQKEFGGGHIQFIFYDGLGNKVGFHNTDLLPLKQNETMAFRLLVTKEDAIFAEFDGVYKKRNTISIELPQF